MLRMSMAARCSTVGFRGLRCTRSSGRQEIWWASWKVVSKGHSPKRQGWKTCQQAQPTTSLPASATLSTPQDMIFHESLTLHHCSGHLRSGQLSKLSMPVSQLRQMRCSNSVARAQPPWRTRGSANQPCKRLRPLLSPQALPSSGRLAQASMRSLAQPRKCRLLWQWVDWGHCLAWHGCPLRAARHSIACPLHSTDRLVTKVPIHSPSPRPRQGMPCPSMPSPLIINLPIKSTLSTSFRLRVCIGQSRHLNTHPLLQFQARSTCQRDTAEGCSKCRGCRKQIHRENAWKAFSRASHTQHCSTSILRRRLPQVNGHPPSTLLYGSRRCRWAFQEVQRVGVRRVYASPTPRPPCLAPLPWLTQLHTPMATARGIRPPIHSWPRSRVNALQQCRCSRSSGKAILRQVRTFQLAAWSR
mmetsp:Transcript_10778/g.31990  ORF Transcript_10778/g.31990 Transcript_10778/m.31990 type:complete len:414 (-) Transcript_10778:409-1650(-)